MTAARSSQRTPEEAIEADLKVLRVAVVGWSDNWTVEGEKVPYSRDAIKKVFGNPVLREAIMAEIGRDQHFMKGA